eukprot:scaffold119749_cov18-Tisochrysis_lutea.AAC.3
MGAGVDEGPQQRGALTGVPVDPADSASWPCVSGCIRVASCVLQACVSRPNKVDLDLPRWAAKLSAVRADLQAMSCAEWLDRASQKGIPQNVSQSLSITFACQPCSALNDWAGPHKKESP